MLPRACLAMRNGPRNLQESVTKRYESRYLQPTAPDVTKAAFFCTHGKWLTWHLRVRHAARTNCCPEQRPRYRYTNRAPLAGKQTRRLKNSPPLFPRTTTPRFTPHNYMLLPLGSRLTCAPHSPHMWRGCCPHAPLHSCLPLQLIAAPVFYNPRRIVPSDIKEIAPTNVEYSYLWDPAVQHRPALSYPQKAPHMLTAAPW